MTEQPGGRDMQAVLSMRGGGYYSERTVGAKRVIDGALPLVRAALPPRPGAAGPLRVADFGAADGGTSRRMWFDTFSAIRAAGDHREIVITYTDLPSNDFSTLFRTMQGLQGDPAHAYQAVLPGIFVHGCGTGFHRQLFPTESLDFAFSATAMHYVSQKPCEITTHVHQVGARGGEARLFAEQARRDWEAILLARARELKPGARFVALNFGIDEHGRYLGNTGGRHMFDTFDALWRGLLEEGRIDRAEYDRATFAQHYRTTEEFVAPLVDDSSPVRAAGLRLVEAKSLYTRCPFEEAFAASASAMSPRAFAESLVPTMRSWSETVFLTALDRRPREEAAAIVDEFYRRYEDLIAADPTGHAMDYIHIVLVMEKV